MPNATAHCDAHPGFYTNPAIRHLAASPRWTVSSSAKAPFNMRGLLDGDQEAVFAQEPTSTYLVTLDELVRVVPDPPNNTFFVDTRLDDLVVLDIEPSAPATVRDWLLRLPALYRETSMSGHGFHLVLPVPRAALGRPGALDISALQHHGFEVLQRHYLTFTRNVVPEPADPLTLDDWESFYGHLVDPVLARRGPTATAGSAAGPLVLGDDLPEHPANETLLRELTGDPVTGSLRPLADFGHDHSSFEFSTLGSLLNRLRLLTAIHDLTLTPDHEAWLIFEALRRIIPPRAKHHESRGGLPLLLDRAAVIVRTSLNR